MSESTSERDGSREPSLPTTPFHVLGIAFLLAGFALALYQGLQEFALVPRVSWITWTHIHFVTVGAFTQLLFGTLPRLTARRLGVESPSRRYERASFLGLNAALLAAWYGRAFGEPLWFDVGLATLWLLTLALLVVLLATVRRAGCARDPTIGFYLLSPLVYLIGLTFAFGLFSHAWDLPGGWYGLREGHVHANAWGFLGLAAIGTLYDVFPRLVDLDADVGVDRLRRYSFPLFAVGILPLAFGPVLGMGRTVTAAGLLLYAVGYLLYVASLVRAYRAGTPNGTALWVLVAQAWILGPAGFAPFILFGVPLGIPDAWIETGALHFFFLGWALPVALAGALLYVGSREGPTDGAGYGGHPLVPDGGVPSVVGAPTVLAWNVAVLLIGVGFFYQDQAWSASLHAVGYAVVLAVWGYYLARIAGRWRTARAVAATA
ncbi:hypothetical protein [Salinilacihabitans rarus]|uniref:hypothetical protein n=1 Tax=Salinilacihabitans rarus TaxID=2961596 RepID=UPI0020C8F10C|nr:hypothetical protein [Salinilacihabitans rarus]